MVKQRLFFGTLMTVCFAALMILDGWLDGSLLASTPHSKVQATVLCLLVGLLAILAQLELAKLLAAVGVKNFTFIVIFCSILLATCWYWTQIFTISLELFIFFAGVGSILALLLYQALRYGTIAAITNCSGNCFTIFYIGLLSSFVLAIRIELGLWPLLMYVFVVKSADIGAYTLGSLFGKHKFSPAISPGKTWEGMAGAVAFAVVVSSIFAATCGIMNGLLGVSFGILFAFLGQLGDLAESMLKRDAQQKDSGHKVPGFGGVLDIIDSPLVAAPFAYLFFTLAAGV